LESILTRAEREFREIHQPDVLRRASGCLEKITDGRYRRVDLLDEDKGLLGVMAPTRQVWILTCHRALADEIEGSLKVSRIDL
jgi:uncharacterized protein YhaN